jgi:hypothetical protein
MTVLPLSRLSARADPDSTRLPFLVFCPDIAILVCRSPHLPQYRTGVAAMD